MMIEAVKLLREGVIGDVLVAKAWNIQRRGTIGRGKPSQPPAGFDYDLGRPRPDDPLPAKPLPHRWHWWYHFGTGDMGNDGVHDIDYARWGLGVETHPTRLGRSAASTSSTTTSSSPTRSKSPSSTSRRRM